MNERIDKAAWPRLAYWRLTCLCLLLSSRPEGISALGVCRSGSIQFQCPIPTPGSPLGGSQSLLRTTKFCRQCGFCYTRKSVLANVLGRHVVMFGRSHLYVL